MEDAEIDGDEGIRRRVPALYVGASFRILGPARSSISSSTFSSSLY
jgi:hypothetical protein